MTDLRKAARDVLDAYDSDEGTLLSQIARDDKAMEALRAALAEPPEAMPRTCNPHPDAPHGFNRNASHSEDRYVCDCEGWEPSSETGEAVRYFFSGKEGCFYASDMKQGENILYLLEVDTDDWTATELPAPPSVDALIADLEILPVDSVTIEEIDSPHGRTFTRVASVILREDLSALLDKYRARGGA